MEMTPAEEKAQEIEEKAQEAEGELEKDYEEAEMHYEKHFNAFVKAGFTPEQAEAMMDALSDEKLIKKPLKEIKKGKLVH